jgi:hypothetical protein
MANKVDDILWILTVPKSFYGLTHQGFEEFLPKRQSKKETVDF